MVFSFDVFDTCLVRSCGSPKNVFEILSYKVMSMWHANDLDYEYLRQQFVDLRVKHGGKLEDVYTKIGKVFSLPGSVEEMVSLELQTERELIRPVLSMRRKIDALRKKGKIVFISDMYLPDTFIKELLVEHGFFQEGDALFVSDSVKAYKYDGTMFPFVRDALGLSYRKWHHYGDDLRGDYAVPKKFGIKCHRIRFEYLPYEQRWIDQVVTTGCQYPSILAGISRSIRLSVDATEGQKNFVADLSAPLMTSWVVEMLRDAQRNQISRIFFCARDMHSYYLIAKRLRGLFPEVEVRYLFVSRTSLYNEDSLRLDYFVQEGLASNDRCAIADAASTGTGYHTINKLLVAHGYHPLARFYCFNSLWKGGLFEGWDREQLREDDAKTCCCICDGFLKSSGSPKTARLMGYRVFFELLFSLNFHSKTVGYRKTGGNVRPVFGGDEEDSWKFQTHEVREMKKDNDLLLASYAKAFVDTGMWRFSDQILERIALTTLAEFLTRPKKDYLDYLHDFQNWGVNYVDKRWRKNVWKRGSTVFSFPEWLMDVVMFFKKK